MQRRRPVPRHCYGDLDLYAHERDNESVDPVTSNVQRKKHTMPSAPLRIPKKTAAEIVELKARLARGAITNEAADAFLKTVPPMPYGERSFDPADQTILPRD